MEQVDGFDTNNGEVVGFVLANYQVPTFAKMNTLLRLEYCQSIVDLEGDQRGSIQISMTLYQLKELNSSLSRMISAIETAEKPTIIQ